MDNDDDHHMDEDPLTQTQEEHVIIDEGQSVEGKNPEAPREVRKG